MPELPEVETIKNALQKAANGAKILKAEVFCDRFRIPVPQDFSSQVQDGTILCCKRIAKYIIIDLDNDKSIIWHLGMSGRVKFCSEASFERQKHDHIVFWTTKGIIAFNDARRFGLMTYCPTSEVKSHELIKKTGLDPFDQQMSGKYLFHKFQNKSTPIKVLLLDQTIICGIGNIYASEALYVSKILPTRPAQSLSLDECESLSSAIKTVLDKAIKAGGSTLKDYRKPDGSMGYFQNAHCVYDKTGKPCPDCKCNLSKSGGIQKIVLGGRSTFYCPVLQK